jgi:uncharacterized protein YgiM (DUF1202 family)
MLWRYVGVTLVALGGAMLVAPEAEDEASSAPQASRPPASETGAVASAPQASAPTAAAREASVAEREAETLLPAALDLVAGTSATEGAEGGGALRLARLDPAFPDASAVPGERSSGPASRTDEPVATAPSPAEMPSLERPDSLRPAQITAETLALIERTEERGAPVRERADEDEPDRLFVSGSRVNVRSGPSTSYAVIGSTVYGEAVELLAFENDAWAWVRFGDDRMGYMARSFLAQDLGDG